MTNLKELTKLKKMLKKHGFKFVREGKHLVYSRNGRQVVVSRNIRNSNMILNKVMKETS